MSEDHRRLAVELDATARALVGRRITGVAYYGLYTDHPPATWDFDTWHCPVMGVELLLDDGAAYSAVWDNPFGHFSLHLYAAPMTSQLTVYEQGGNGLRWTVHDHARWAPLLAGPVLDSRLIWHPHLTDFGHQAPAALHLTFPAGSVWIIAAMESTEETWWLGADEVVVAFTSDMAARTGVRGPG
ncbi:hypothetical protein [Polymorphospora rubra]|nr:hypothetical protein [Polymorphospora rubra]